MSTTILVSNATLADALKTTATLGLILGQDCRLEFDHSLTIDVDAVLRHLEANPRPAEDINPAEEPPQPTQQPERIDRIIPLSESYGAVARAITEKHERQLEMLALHSEPEAAFTDLIRSTVRARLELRSRIIEPWIEGDIKAGSTLVYGRREFSGAECLLYPDGKLRDVEALIHDDHPVSPEDLFLREHRTNAKRIYRYRIERLDDQEWAFQNDLLNPLDAQGWRELLTQRLSYV